MQISWERRFLGVIHGNKQGFVAFLAKSGLQLLSFGYMTAVFTRNLAYKWGVFPEYHPPVSAVVSVGNIVVGGTGKTPVTLLLAEELSNSCSVAIVSRGYRGKAERLTIPITLSQGKGPEFSASYSGDEPYLLAKRLPEVSVYVGRNRKKASVIASKEGANVIILEDGMQHRKMAREFEIVVIDAHDPFGKGYFLPRGFLRESPKELQRASLIVVNHVEEEDEKSWNQLNDAIRKYTAAPIVGAKPVVSSIAGLKDESITSLSGKKVGIFCGIAKPEHFRALVERHGAIVVDELFGSDHTIPKKEKLVRFANHCKDRGAEYLVCTEKDKVKLTGEIASPLPIISINIRLKIVKRKEDWDALVNQIKKRVKRI